MNKILKSSDNINRMANGNAGEKQKVALEPGVRVVGTEADVAGVVKATVDEPGEASEQAGLEREEADGEIAETATQEVSVDRERMSVGREGIGGAREQRGAAREKAGVARERVGAAREEAGVEREKVGAAREEAGVAREKGGAAREEVGAAREKAGVAREKVGAAREEAGVAREKGGAAREEVGAEREKVGVAREEAGVEREKVGAAREEVGAAREKAGVARERVGAAREEAGVARAKAGVAREEVGAEREKVGVAREEAGVERERVGAVREEVGVEREKVGVAREKAGVARERVGAAREEVGAAREKAGVDRERVGAAREEAGVARERGGAAREKAGKAREKVGAAREQASAAREKGGAERERAGAVREKAEKEETARAWSFIEILKKVGLVANTATSVGEALEVTLDEVMKHFGYEVGHAYCKYGPERKQYWRAKVELSREFRDLSEKVFIDRTGKPEQVGIVGIALATQRPAWTTNAEDWGMPVRKAAMKEAGLHSGIVCPILSRDEVVGVMEFESTKQGEPPVGVSDLLSDIGVQMGRAIERVQAQEKLQGSETRLRARVEAMERLQTEMGLINETGNLLDGCRSEEEVGGVLSEYGGHLFPDCAGDLYLIEEEGSGMRRVAAWGGSKGVERFDVADCWALRRGRMHETGVVSSLRCAHVGESGNWDLCIPLQAHQGTLGVLHLQGLHEAQEVSAVRKSLASNLAEHVSLALVNFELRERLRYQAFHDLLTGLYNLRHFEETLTKALASAGSEGHLALIKLDIDLFKSFNDDYGHDFGDEALRVLSSFLERKVRSQDTLSRVGGEEFMILMPETDLNSAMTRAEQIRLGVLGVAARREGDARKITVSVGVAAYPEHGQEYVTLMRSADEALYKSKQNGRNQVTAAGGEEAEEGGRGAKGQ